MTGKLFSIKHQLAFASLFAVMPLAISLTRIGYYTSECFGVFFFLVSLYFLIRVEEKNCFAYLASTIIFSTLLILTWQLFAVFSAIVLILLLIRARSISSSGKYLAILLVPLALSHVISVYIVAIGYSPINVLKEIYVGAISSNTPDYSVALYRSKLIQITFMQYLFNYGWLGVILPGFGFIKCLIKMKQPRYYVFLIGGTISFMLFCIYVKYRMIAFPFLLIICCIGAAYLYDDLLYDLMDSVAYLGRKAKRFLKRK